MKSIKPGRGPSMMSGTIGIFMIVFGLVWTIVAGSFAPVMALFGLLWTGIAVVITVYNFKNATGKNRYSSFDITEHGEEPDPLNARFGNEQKENEQANTDSRFCPYCGAPVKEGFAFCNRCGKKLP